MPLKAPNLDTRDFETLYREAQLRIPRYTPEWTDFNDSDPGMTLVQLFAWLTEMMLFEMNQVPDRNYIKFLQLLNMELKSARPATAHLTFSAQPDAEKIPVVRRGTQVTAQPPEGGDTLIFETEEGLSLIRPPLAQIYVSDGTAFTDVTLANQAKGSSFHPFGWVPQVGSALYLGFGPADPETGDELFPQAMRFRVFLPMESQVGKAQRCKEVKTPPSPPVTLVWEYKPTPKAKRWRQLNVYEDESVAFTREGSIKLEGPGKIAATSEGKTPPEGEEAVKHYWLRCRVAEGSYPSGHAPVIDFLRPNTVAVKNLSTVRDERVGVSEGYPDQVFTLHYTPVQADSLELEVESGGKRETWTRIEDFLASDREDKHYVLNATKGEIRFGDGKRGLIPPADAEITARVYRYGGGKAGNVGAGLINALSIPLQGVEGVTNERPAVGGTDEQDIKELRALAPKVLRSRGRAITAEDFEALAMEVGGVAKATAIPLAHPDYPDIEVPGAVTVVIVPDTDDPVPAPSSDLIRTVARYLDEHRLLTTEVHIKGPDYQRIEVTVKVTAQPYAAFGAIVQDVKRAINTYLDPLGRKIGDDDQNDESQDKGNDTRGWEFGLEFYPTNLYSVIKGANEGIVSVDELEVTVNGKPWDVLRKPVRVPEDGLVCGAEGHEINVASHKNL
jgi:predicted phage baseplate assembly protein